MTNFFLPKITFSCAFYYSCNAAVLASCASDIESSTRNGKNGLIKFLLSNIKLDAEEILVRVLGFFCWYFLFFFP